MNIIQRSILNCPKLITPSFRPIVRLNKTNVVNSNSKIEKKQNTFLVKCFGKYLLLTNTVSAGVLMAAGDVISQEIEFRKGKLKNRYDMKRIGRMFLVGSLQGPLHHYFYNWLAKIMPQPTVQNALKKILWDQFVMSPACILLFFYPASMLEDKSFIESTQELKAKFSTVYITDWCVWPIAQFVNFYYLSTKYNVMFVNVVTMLYNIFLSNIKHKEELTC